MENFKSVNCPECFCKTRLSMFHSTLLCEECDFPIGYSLGENTIQFMEDVMEINNLNGDGKYYVSSAEKEV